MRCKSRELMQWCGDNMYCSVNLFPTVTFLSNNMTNTQEKDEHTRVGQDTCEISYLHVCLYPILLFATASRNVTCRLSVTPVFTGVSQLVRLCQVLPVRYYSSPYLSVCSNRKKCAHTAHSDAHKYTNTRKYTQTKTHQFSRQNMDALTLGACRPLPLYRRHAA